MQKTLDILEKNVQWFVLGLAAVFLAWVAYDYVVTPPASIKVGNEVAVAGNVSELTKRTADQLDRQIKSGGTAHFPTPDLVSDWEQHVQQPYGIQLASGDFGSEPENSVRVKTTGPIGNVKIAGLPLLPKVQPQPPVAGLSTVSTAPLDAPNNPNAAPPVAGQPAAQQTKDSSWIMVSGVIPAAALSQALIAPLNGQTYDPATLAAVYNTTLLQVTLERQQATGFNASGVPIFPAGDQGIEVVPSLAIDQPLVQKMPYDSDPMTVRYQYVDWAQQHQDLIGGPAFNAVTAGDPWTPPQMPAPGAVPTPGATPTPAAAPVAPVTPASTEPPAAPPPATTPPAAPVTPNPATPAKPTTPTATPPQNPTQSSPPPVSNTRPVNTRNGTSHTPAKASYAPYDPARPAGSGFPGQYDPRGGFNRGRPFNGGRNFNPNFGNPGGGNNGQGVLNPFSITSDVLIWAIDETAKAGQTYRYRFIYKLKNPVFGVQNMAPQNLVDQLAITSPPSDWTDAVKAPAMTKFWLADADVRNERAKLDVFRYKEGTWTASKNWPASPGDQVPGTGLTLVDVRTGDKHEKYVLLATDTGELQRRDQPTDAADPDHTSMLQPTDPNANPNPAAPPPPPPPSRFRRPPPPPGPTGRPR